MMNGSWCFWFENILVVRLFIIVLLLMWDILFEVVFMIDYLFCLKYIFLKLRLLFYFLLVIVIIFLIFRLFFLLFDLSVLNFFGLIKKWSCCDMLVEWFFLMLIEFILMKVFLMVLEVYLLVIVLLLVWNILVFKFFRSELILGFGFFLFIVV